ncbi:MAG TPA: imidazolonepropionase [Candidatus Limnocylindrales bacterium]|nr:imidazolonepropionase [Candidatus Limnocylindrales bacterium]
MLRADFAIRHAGRLLTMEARRDDPYGTILDGALAAFLGRVVWVGPDARFEANVALAGDAVDAGGCLVTPGLVDAHTHPVFAGSRADEFAERLSGVAYADQQGGERGIQRTVLATRAASEDDLVCLAVERAHRFLAHGTTTIEAKTGYGLDLEQERKLLRVLRRLAALTPLRVIPTFLGAHVVPRGVDRATYVRTIVEEMLPAFRHQARFCDVWCDAPAFTAAESRAILRRARELGYGLRMHAAQLGPGEGPSIGAELAAASVDHLEYATPAQVQALAAAGTTAVLCPGAALTVPGSPRPPLDALREYGVPVAIASDLNPGTCNSESLTFAMSAACVLWGMTPAETLIGATRGGARSLGLEGEAGRLGPGHAADCAIFDLEAPEEIPYHVGVNRVKTTVVGGRVVTPP